MILKPKLNNAEGISLTLNSLVINLAFPAVIFSIVPNMQLDTDVFIPFLSYWLLIPIVWGLSFFIAKQCHWPNDVRCVMLVLCICGNTAFLGIPMSRALLGEEALAYALLYDQLGSFLGVSILVTVIIAIEQSYNDTINGHENGNGNTSGKINVKKIIIKVLSFPPFAALLICLFLPVEELVAPIKGLLHAIGQLVVPATMLAVGLQFSVRLSREYYWPLAIILSVKMLLLPLLVWGSLWLANKWGLETHSLVISTTVFQTAAAPMVTAAALLSAARIATPLVSSALGIGTLLSFILLPIWAKVLV